MKYSVIIPVYKAEKTIRRCLDSLLQQPHNDVEILVINDGSPDNSGKICKEYAVEYPCIRYFEKENGGVSSARNVGLEEAIGDYILFVDSDDYVDAHYFRTINTVLEEHHPDMLIFAYKNVGSGNQTWSLGNYVARDEPEVANRISEAMKKYLFSNLMTKTFDRKIIQKYQLKFNKDLSIGEDQEFIFKYAMHIEKLVSISEILYSLVLENSESLSRKKREYLSDQLLTVNKAMLAELQKKKNIDDGVKKIYYDSIVWMHYRSAYSACMELHKYDMSTQERRRKIREICKAFLLKEMKPHDISCKMIAFPFIYHLSFVVDTIVKHRYIKRNSTS